MSVLFVQKGKTPAPAGSVVWIVRIGHKHGENLNACSSEERAREVVLEYVEENWASWMNKPMSGVGVTDVQNYFEEAHSNEWAEVEEVKVY